MTRVAAGKLGSMESRKPNKGAVNWVECFSEVKVRTEMSMLFNSMSIIGDSN